MSPEDLRYSEEHEWVRTEGDEAVVGITDFAQAELGDIVGIELPEDNKQVGRMDNLAVIESVKAASDIFAPVTGTISAVNSELEDSPEIINASPYDEGWICRIKMSDPGELKELMDNQKYEEYIKGLEE